jgi:MoaA/NifB/PqqE/SkfB family radical SAM enzyme
MAVIEIRKQTKLFHMYWTLTDFCNFRCNYCPSHLHSGDYHSGRKAGFPTDKEIDTFLDLLISDYLPGKQLSLAIGGGEPTLHPMFPAIVEKMSPYGEISVTTNGGRSVDWWATLPKLPDVVIISLHHEFTKLDKINEISHFLVDAGVNLTFNLSCDPGNWNNAVSMYEGLDDDLKRYVQPKVLNYIGQDRGTYHYTNEQRAWITTIQRKFIRNFKIKRIVKMIPSVVHDNGSITLLNNLSELTLKNDHIYTGWECFAGQETFNIHFDGVVYSSVCKQVKVCNLVDFKPLTESFICQMEACACPSDLLASKKKV